MFGPSDWPFGPETVPCEPPCQVEPPEHCVISWEKGNDMYKLKVYPLEGDMTFAYIDEVSLGLAQTILEDLLR